MVIFSLLAWLIPLREIEQTGAEESEEHPHLNASSGWLKSTLEISKLTRYN